MANILVTGATSGIGYKTALELAALGHHVGVHGRSEDKANAVRAEIEQAGGQATVFIADLMSLERVAGLASDVLAQWSNIDVLINNAGLIQTETVATPDGHESTWGVNHLAPFLLTLLLMDAAGIVVAFMVAYGLRQIIPLPEALPAGAPQLASYRDLILLMVGSIIAIAFTSKHYYIPRAPSRVAQIYQVFASVSIGLLLTIALATFLFKNREFVTDFPRAITLYTWALAIILLSAIRIIHQWMRGFLRGQGIGVDRLLVIGTGSAAKNTVAHIKNSPHLGYDLIGVVSAEKQSKRRYLGLPVHGTLADLPRLLEELTVSDVIIAMPERQHREVKAAVEHCKSAVSPSKFSRMYSTTTPKSRPSTTWVSSRSSPCLTFRRRGICCSLNGCLTYHCHSSV